MGLLLKKFLKIQIHTVVKELYRNIIFWSYNFKKLIKFYIKLESIHNFFQTFSIDISGIYYYLMKKVNFIISN